MEIALSSRLEEDSACKLSPKYHCPSMFEEKRIAKLISLCDFSLTWMGWTVRRKAEGSSPSVCYLSKNHVVLDGQTFHGTGASICTDKSFCTDCTCGDLCEKWRHVQFMRHFAGIKRSGICIKSKRTRISIPYPLASATRTNCATFHS